MAVNIYVLRTMGQKNLIFSSTALSDCLEKKEVIDKKYGNKHETEIAVIKR